MSEAPARSRRVNLFESHASQHPEKTAVIGPARSFPYAQLRERARALAKQLYGLGLRPGDQAALMAYNLPEYSEISQALEYLRVGMVMVGYRMKPPEIEFIVDNSDSKVFFFWHEFADRILPFKERYKKMVHEGFVCFGGPAEGARDYEGLFNEPPGVDLDLLSTGDVVGSSPRSRGSCNT
jgi:acyl-CoA synthetase (AMP-forming)/AMP-acid ligase II